MKENIPLIIGRQSSGEECTVNLVDLPNLFISHSQEGQLPEMFASLLKNINQLNSPVLFACSLSSTLTARLNPLVPQESLLLAFKHGHYEPGEINVMEEFIMALTHEFKRRKSLSKKSATSTPSHTTLVVFIDDIFEVIMCSHKKTVLSFMELLITGAQVKFYFIMGSSGIYRNLLNQLINVSPSLQQKLKKWVQSQHLQPLGAELVMNPDGLLFFRERAEKIHRRLYPSDSLPPRA